MSSPCIYGRFCLGGAEIGNTDRTLGYVSAAKANGRLCCVTRCPPPRPTGCYLDWDGCEYTYPANPHNPAPWYDPLIPESQLFYGIIFDTINGLDAPSFTRSTNNGKLGSIRYEGRKLEFSGTMFASSCVAADYGKQWLSQALNVEPCFGCGTGDLTYRKFCPKDYCCEPPVSTFTDNGMRTMHDVGLLEPPVFSSIFSNPTTPLSDSGSCAECHCMIQRVTFTLLAENHKMFLEPIPACASNVWDLSAPACPDWCAVEPEAPLICTPPDSTDSAAWGPVCDFCKMLSCACDFSNLSAGSPGWCEPLGSVDNWCTIPAQPAWLGSASVITIKAGSKDLRNLRIAAYENELGLACPDAFAPGKRKPCAVLEIPYLCAGTTLVIDGGKETVAITAPGVSQRGDAYVYGDQGSAFSWVRPGCNPLCIVARADVLNTATDASFTISAVPYEVA